MLVTLISSDDKSFTVDSKLLKHSGTLSAGDSINPGPIPLFKVNGEILQLVIDWLTYHKDDPPYGKEDDNSEMTGIVPIPLWDHEFLSALAIDTFFGLMNAANFLDIKVLLTVTLKAFASKIKVCRSSEEIRKVFNIENDMTAEQQERIMKENSWRT